MGCDMSFIKKTKLNRSRADIGEVFEKRILLLGLDNAGKTSLLFQMRDKEFRATVPTVGLNIEHIDYKRYSLTFWDVGGQATKLWKHYFDKIDAVVFVIDSTDEEKLLFAREEFNRILKDESLQGVPILLFYNKTDLKDIAKPAEQLSKHLEVESHQQEREISVQGCSALNGTGVWEGIDKVITMFEERKNGEVLNLKDKLQQQDVIMENATTGKESKMNYPQ